MSSLFLTLLACGAGYTPEQAAEAARAAVVAANPTSRVGLELVGRSRWVKGDMFEAECLHSKDLAFSEDPEGRTQRISPTYVNQRFITADTERGWCVLLGDGLQVEVGTPAPDGQGLSVPVTFKLAQPTPWFECLKDEVKTRKIPVRPNAEGVLEAQGELALVPPGCPSPMPAGEERGASAQPQTKPPKAPTKDEVIALMTRFNDAIRQRDRISALGMVSCYNLYEEKKVGSCTPAELVQVGPHDRGAVVPGFGISWLETALVDFSDIGAIRADPKIPTMFHVLAVNPRTKRERSFSVEWVDGAWRLVGVVGAMGADLTSLRFVYDLHKADRRDIFLRRLAGEAIDEQGNSTKPEEDAAQ